MYSHSNNNLGRRLNAWQKVQLLGLNLYVTGLLVTAIAKSNYFGGSCLGVSETPAIESGCFTYIKESEHNTAA
jgi:hypothetical protein